MNDRVAGCDLGKATAKFVTGRLEGDRFVVESSQTLVHEGKPLDAFRDWYRRERVAESAALGATGIFADALIAPALCPLPEDACLEAALRSRPDLAGALNVVSVGARGYSVLTRDERGRIQHVENDKCSSGTGENMVKLAQRFGLELAEADRLAAAADRSIAITARCSVFAKSEMTHFANQGKAADELFRGFFESIARYVMALLSRARVAGPLYLVGGGSQLAALVAAFRRAAGGDVAVPEGALLLEALGAARLAAEQARAERLAALPADPDALVREKAARIRVLAPARESAHRVRVMTLPPPPDGAAAAPSILGLDLGSTGSKAVLTSLATGDPVLDVYDRTRGNPVEAAARLVRSILDQVRPDVRAVAVTGSGREAVATVMRAAYPELADRIVVLNEIVAHATAAMRCDEDRGESLSVVEIGGQDAKFIQIAGGQIVESDLNKACSAGTGSFLEEQAVFYGVHDIGEFTRLAQEAARPPDLGQMCTVFVAEAAGEAHRQGFTVPDLFGGFQYSVVHNYIHRVMGQRTLQKRVFFQGKPASGASLAWTLAAVTGREVVVPPNPGAMGAWGIGLCALGEVGAEKLAAAQPFDLDAYLSATIVARAEFQCQDKRCATLCRIDRTTVAVGGVEKTVFSGGSCPKFELPAIGRAKLPIEAPSAFDERDALLAPYLEPSPRATTIGVAHVGATYGYLPWLVTLVRELGLGVKVLRSDHGSLQRGEERCYSYDSCAPAKIAHAVVDDPEVDAVFLPKLLDLPDREGPGGRTCPVEQAMPEVVEQALRDRGRDLRVIRPALHLKAGLGHPVHLEPLARAFAALGVDPLRVYRAVERAAAAQERYETELRAVGQRTLDWGRRNGVPVVVVCGSLHVIYDPAVNAGIPALLRQNSVLALPVDAYPIPDKFDRLERIVWGDANRSLRVAIAARERADAFPLWLSSFGCGPGSFNEQFFAQLMDGVPHTVLESDGHGGAAGFVTRIQAFLHAVRQHGRAPSPAPKRRLDLLHALPEPPIRDEKQSRLVMFPLGDRLSPLMAAVFRSFGYDAVSSGPTSADILAAGRRDCSGKECIPYQLIWGGFRKHLEEHPPEKRTVLVQVSGDGSCRNCMFSIKDQLTLQHMELADLVALRHVKANAKVHFAFAPHFWASVVAWDLLNQLAGYHRPFERTPGEVDEIYARRCDELERLLAQPVADGARAILQERRLWKQLDALATDAAREFAALRERYGKDGQHRTVLLTGDVYVRLDEFASDGLVRRLNERGLRVVVEPLSVLLEYLALERSDDLAGLPTGLVHNRLFRVMMQRQRDRLYKRAQPHHPWLNIPRAAPMIAASRAVIDVYPRGEAPITVGSVLHNWHERACDGVVVAGPWGCGPALISESLLKHQHEIPLLFVYHDGSPLEERRLNSFAFRLRRDARRTAA